MGKKGVKRSQVQEESSDSQHDTDIIPFGYDREGEEQYQSWLDWVRQRYMPYDELYWLAYRLLPDIYVYGGEKEDDQKMVQEAVAVLAQAGMNRRQILWALALLGNSPCPRAVDALQNFCARDHPLSPVARCALKECEDGLRWHRLSEEADG